MGEPYTIRIFVPDGDPQGVKVIEMLNWTGVAVAFPRQEWTRIRTRQEFKRAGVYVLIGSAEGVADDLPTVCYDGLHAGTALHHYEEAAVGKTSVRTNSIFNCVKCYGSDPIRRS